MMIAQYILAWFLALLYIEAVTEIIINGSVFNRPRNWLSKKSEFFSGLLSCGYCFSVWVSTIAVFLPGKPISCLYDNDFGLIGDAVVKIFAAHRLSNIFHEFIHRWLNKVPIMLRDPLVEEDTIVNVGDEDEDKE